MGKNILFREMRKQAQTLPKVRGTDGYLVDHYKNMKRLYSHKGIDAVMKYIEITKEDYRKKVMERATTEKLSAISPYQYSPWIIK